MLPPALVTPLTISIIPSVTAALTLNNYREARRTEESAIRMTALISLPCGAGLAVLASPIQELLYDYDAETLSVAGPLLAILGVAVVFNCMVSVTNAILQAHGKVTIPIYTTLVGGLVNVITDYVLIGMESVGIYGAAIATIAYCAVIMFLNILAMHRVMDLPPRILKQFVKPIVATAAMSVGAYLSYEAVRSTLNSLTLAVLVSVIVACVIYFALVYLMKIITWYDCQLLPKGDLLARLLRVQKPAQED
jgi:stage V sporulation protein B